MSATLACRNPSLSRSLIHCLSFTFPDCHCRTAAAGIVSIVGGIIAIGVALLGIIAAITLSRILIGIVSCKMVVYTIVGDWSEGEGGGECGVGLN